MCECIALSGNVALTVSRIGFLGIGLGAARGIGTFGIGAL